jgi:transposase-like protein
VATKIGCVPQTLQTWIQQAEAKSQAPVSDEERIRLLEREVKELKRTNEILRLASAFFAQAELDRPSKKR